MPILAPEPAIVPENLLSTAEGESDAKWWVLHTRPRTEKALTRRLLPHGVSYFLPQYEQRRRTGGRTTTTQLLLFPNYVFIHANAEGLRFSDRADAVRLRRAVMGRRQASMR